MQWSGAFPSMPPSPTGRGARFGPQAIRRASAIFDNDPQYPFARDLFEAMTVIDYGDCLLDYGNHAATPKAIETEGPGSSNPAPFLLSLGGDHFVTWPLLKAHAAVHGPLALVHFDAHQDTWDDDGQAHRPRLLRAHGPAARA